MNLSQRRNRARYQKRRKCVYTLLLVQLPYSIDKAITIRVFDHSWNQHCIIWVMQYVSEYIIRRKQKYLLEIQNKCRRHFCRDIFMGHHKEKNEKQSIIVLRNGIHPRHIIYFLISLIIQLCVSYYKRGTGMIVVLQFAVNVYLIPI